MSNHSLATIASCSRPDETALAAELDRGGKKAGLGKGESLDGRIFS